MRLRIRVGQRVCESSMTSAIGAPPGRRSRQCPRPTPYESRDDQLQSIPVVRFELHNYRVDSLLEHDLAGANPAPPRSGPRRQRLLDLLRVQR